MAVRGSEIVHPDGVEPRPTSLRRLQEPTSVPQPVGPAIGLMGGYGSAPPAIKGSPIICSTVELSSRLWVPPTIASGHWRRNSATLGGVKVDAAPVACRLRSS